jgi:polar amino acid transport system substrate-binding protein
MKISPPNRWFFHAAFSMLVALPSAHATELVVLYGDENYPPYSYIENREFVGIDVDILRMAAAKLAPAYHVELVPTPWKRGLAQLQNGTGFGLFPPGLKHERNYIDRYSTAILRESVVVFCNRMVMRNPRKNFPKDFAGLTIGINAGFLLSDRLARAAAHGIVRLEPAKDNNANLKKMALHRIDCYASDRMAALFSAKKLGDELNIDERVLQVAAELSDENTYIAYSAKNAPTFKADFITKMNSALSAMKSNGDIDRIIQRYLAAP